MTKISDLFAAALLSYIQQNVDQLAKGIDEWSESIPSCCNCRGEDSCWGAGDITVEVVYRVPREVNRFGRTTWRYDGDMTRLIRLLDDAQPPTA